MRILWVLVIIAMSCRNKHSEKPVKTLQVKPENDTANLISYSDLKNNIKSKRKAVAKSGLNATANSTITDLWIESISNGLYKQWENTPWDFNGTTTIPKKGSIACGYFVTTMLRDMDLKINRVKLATCASSIMMKSLVPNQKLKNLSFFSYDRFNDSIKSMGKGIYIIGLDFHTGFIVNDGKENWFIHSNYINRKGVVKETVIDSKALRASKTRWMVTLTGDPGFVKRWVAAN